MAHPSSRRPPPRPTPLAIRTAPDNYRQEMELFTALQKDEAKSFLKLVNKHVGATGQVVLQDSNATELPGTANLSSTDCPNFVTTPLHAGQVSTLKDEDWTNLPLVERLTGYRLLFARLRGSPIHTQIFKHMGHEYVPSGELNRMMSTLAINCDPGSAGFGRPDHTADCEVVFKWEDEKMQLLKTHLVTLESFIGLFALAVEAHKNVSMVSKLMSRSFQAIRTATPDTFATWFIKQSSRAVSAAKLPSVVSCVMKQCSDAIESLRTESMAMAKKQYGMMNTKEFKAFSKGFALKSGWEGVEDQFPVKLEKPGCEGCGEDDVEGLKKCGK